MGMFDGLFGGSKKDPYKEARQYLDKMEPMLHQYYDPYVSWGNQAMPTLEEQYAMLLQNPSALYASLGSEYQTSPGYQFQLDQALNAGNQAMSAGGMLGTPAHQQQNMGYAQGLANQDYNNYMARMLDMYGLGLSGTQGQLGYGYNASNQLASGLGNLYGSQANLAFGGAASQNKQSSDMWGSILGLAGTAAGSLLGPAGAVVGNQIGQTVGGWMK